MTTQLAVAGITVTIPADAVPTDSESPPSCGPATQLSGVEAEVLGVRRGAGEDLGVASVDRIRGAPGNASPIVTRVLRDLVGATDARVATS